MDRSTLQFVLALMVVLGGVTVGYFLTSRHENPTAAGRTSALGHVAPPIVHRADTNEMVWIPGGTSRMGSENGNSDERSVQQITVEGFWMDKAEVTNEQFAKFVAETGYVTVAETRAQAKGFAGASVESLGLGNEVFSTPPEGFSFPDQYRRWKYIPGSDWRHPEGADSNIRGREKQPVLRVGWKDAVAFAVWAGKRLPTRGEWECAVRRGLDRNETTSATKLATIILEDGGFRCVWQP